MSDLGGLLDRKNKTRWEKYGFGPEKSGFYYRGPSICDNIPEKRCIVECFEDEKMKIYPFTEPGLNRLFCVPDHFEDSGIQVRVPIFIRESF